MNKTNWAGFILALVWTTGIVIWVEFLIMGVTGQ